MSILRSILVCCTIALGVLWNAPGIRAQEKNVPPRALLVANHLRTLSFEQVLPGLSALRTLASNGVELIILRLKPPGANFDGFKFGLIKQATQQGEWVDEMGKRQGALVVFNGGFFSVNKQGQRSPVGLLAKNNVHFSHPWKKAGGYLIFRDGGISILPTLGNSVPVAEWVLQSKPVLIEPGGNWAMNNNLAIPKKRTLVCKDGAGDVVVLAIISGGLSLYEAGWLMRDSNVGGLFGCDSAIAMDGGGSTQIWVKDRPDLSFEGETPIHNGVVIGRQ